MPEPELNSKNMSVVHKQIPNAYLFLGAAVGEPSEWETNHSPRAAFDDSVVPDAAAFLAECALRRLRAEPGGHSRKAV